MDAYQLIDAYLSGAQMLRDAVAGMSEEDLDAAPIAGKWSTRQVVCHVADFEPIYADRMKRVIAEDRPTFFGGDPNIFAARLAYSQREVAVDLDMVEAVRRHVASILRALSPQDLQREGIHSTDGPVALQTLLQRVTNHIPHHVKFIQEKRAALGR